MADPASLPLFASLQKEAQDHGQRLDPSDAKFAAKLKALSDRVPREYEILQVFRAFLADPQHPAPFWFPDRFDKYRRLMAEGKKAPEKRENKEPARCPKCNSFLLPESDDGLIPCNVCRTWYRFFNGRLTETTVEEITFTSIPRAQSSEKHADFPEGAA